MLRSWAARSRTRDDDVQPAEKKRRYEEDQSETTPADQPTSSLRRSEKAKKLCLLRDRETCLITNASEPIEACHIFPSAMGMPTGDAKSIFWGTVSIFWTTAQLTNGKIKSLENSGQRLSRI
ncbi:hypothetical protein ASPCAL03655 [Aspergillus calidoustus]|uniref:HNH nuclease domain-containing protein n=1 Tax=Aspergillus calidoustus TaxID=454130 RepID=A0A0U4YYY3_ASPCI|nr:hypothetical protein ASPCAL03655 [Aspergillus calidoustus]